MNDTEQQTSFSNRSNARSWALRALAYCRRTFVKAAIEFKAILNTIFGRGPGI